MELPEGLHYLLREQVMALHDGQLKLSIILDEVQKVSSILNEVHWLIENTSAYFILCGSSACKLRRGSANLLSGIAWRFTFYRLVYSEIPDFDLLRVLNNGLIASHYTKKITKHDLNAYVKDYLKEEIQDKGLIRNLSAFARFLDALAYSHGQQSIAHKMAVSC